MSWWDASLSARLDPAALGLHGRELEIAQIIAEETEAQREIERSQLPPATPDELAAIVSGPGLLAGGLETEGQRRRRHIDSLSWDTLLLRGSAHTRCAERAGLELGAVIEFAMAKCNAPSWETLFWYRQWMREALSDKMPREAVHELLKTKQAEGAAMERRAQSAKGGAGKKAAYADIEKFVVDQWAANGWRYESKQLFAEAICAEVLDRFKRTLKTSTITDKYLLPSRLSGKIRPASKLAGK